MVRHPATSLITSSQPLTLLLAAGAAVYDLPTGTVSLRLAVDSARTAVEPVVLSTMPARQSGTHCLMNLETDSFDSFKRFMKTVLFSRARY